MKQTLALKDMRDPLVSMDFKEEGITEPRRQTIDTHWFRFNESPTNTILRPLKLSSNLVALNLFYQHIYHLNI